MTQLTRKHKSRILIILTCMLFMTMAATDIYVPSLPEMVNYFHTTSTIINFTLSVYSLGIAIGVLFVGELSNRFGRRNILIYGSILFTIMAFSIAASHNIYLIIFLRFIQSLATSTIIIVPRLILKDCMDEREQIKSNGILLIGLIVSPAIAPVIGAYLAHYFHWQMCFIANGVFALILTLICIKMIPETNQKRIEKFDTLSNYVTSYISIFKSRTFLALTIIYSGAVGAYYGFISVSSYLYINDWHWTSVNYSYLYLIISAAYLIGNVYMQKLNKKRIDPIKIISMGVYSTLLGVIILSLSIFFFHTVWIAALLVSLGVIFMRAANAIINPTTQVRMMTLFSDKSAQALGLNMFLSFFMSSVTTYLTTIFPQYPLQSLVIVSLVFIIIAVLAFAMNKKLLLNGQD